MGLGKLGRSRVNVRSNQARTRVHQVRGRRKPRWRRLLGAHQLDPLVQRQGAVDQARQRRGHGRLQAGALDRRAPAAARSRAPRPPGRGARGSRPPARPRPAARPRCGCATSAPGPWPRGRPCRRGPRRCGPCRPRARPAPAPRGRCRRRPFRLHSGPAPAWRPTATAAAFLATPASSTPTGSSDTSQTTPARWNTSATRWASGSECEAQTSPAPDSTISRACAGPPTQAVRSAPNARSSATVGGDAVGRARGPWPATPRRRCRPRPCARARPAPRPCPSRAPPETAGRRAGGGPRRRR